VAVVCDGSPKSPDSPRCGGADGPQPSGRSGAFPTRSPDGLISGLDGPRWRRVIFFSSYDLDLVPWGRFLRVLLVSRSLGASPDDVESPRN
jgi:hypothetical protein